jgi:hypothetical protein
MSIKNVSDIAALQRARQIATSALAGEVPLLLACREIAALRSRLLDLPPETLEGFVTVASETDISPLGEERQYWERKTLAARDRGNAEYLAEVKHLIEDDLKQFLAVTATSNERSD